MPRGDGTGPMGAGPMTGQGKGVCILRFWGEDGDRITGFAGVDGKRVEVVSNNASAYAKATADEKEVSQMPGGDGTGPMRAGPMTGRGAGYCAGNAVPGYANPVPGRGFGRGFAGRGRGGGWGRRNWFYATGMPGWTRAGAGMPAWGGYPPYVGAPTADQELHVLKGQAEYFGGALENIKNLIEELEAGKKTE